MKFTQRTRWLSVAALFLSITLAAGACSSDKAVKSPPKKTTTTTSTTTTVAEPTTTLAPPATAPLTGLAPPDPSLMGRPALAVKIDNSPEAIPQTGINKADIVFEIKVEGISRLMAVFHSQDADKLGPTRSARYSDPDILALFGKPLFGWSGANDGVIKAVEDSPWIVNVNWGVGGNDRYFRTKDKAAPHNLYTKTQNLYPLAQPGQPAPAPIFDYLAAGEANPGSSPMPGLSEQILATDSKWVFDPALNQYVRWQYGKVDKTADDGQVRAENVVVLQIPYTGGTKAPIAVTLGSGTAWVNTGGTIVQGTWTRDDRTKRFELKGANGEPLKVAPGRTWVELLENPPAPMDAGTASGLLASPR